MQLGRERLKNICCLSEIHICLAALGGCRAHAEGGLQQIQIGAVPWDIRDRVRAEGRDVSEGLGVSSQLLGKDRRKVKWEASAQALPVPQQGSRLPSALT